MATNKASETTLPKKDINKFINKYKNKEPIFFENTSYVFGDVFALSFKLKSKSDEISLYTLVGKVKGNINMKDIEQKFINKVSKIMNYISEQHKITIKFEVPKPIEESTSENITESDLNETQQS